VDPTRMKAATAELFDLVADDYDRAGMEFFRPAANRLVEHVRLHPGEQVLDVGCGRGAVLFPAAEAVGPSGYVLGIDLSPAMVRLTVAEVARAGLVWARVRVMDAEEPDLPEHRFDAVLGSYSIVLFPGAPAALARYRRLLREGGRLGFTAPVVHEMGLPQSFPDELAPVFAGVVTALRALPDAPPLFEPGRLWYAEPDAIRHTVRAAGFDDVRVHSEHLPVVIESGESWLRWSWAQAQRMLWLRLPEVERKVQMERIASAFDALRGADGLIRFTVPLRYVVAH